MTINRMDDTLIDVPRGLTNVVAAETALGDVRGHEGFYHYRQYSAVELAERRTFEEAWHLLLFGTPARPRPSSPPSVAASPRLAGVPADVRALLPAIARLTASRRSAGRAAHGARRGGRRGRRADRSTTRAPRSAMSRRHPGRRRSRRCCSPTLHALRSGEQLRGPRGTTSDTSPTTCSSSRAQAPDARREHALERLHDGRDRPRLQRLDVRGPGHRLHRGRPRRPRSAARSARCRVRSTAERPGRALDTLDEIGTPDRTDAWVRRHGRARAAG